MRIIPFIVLLALFGLPAKAGPWAAPGDTALRSDIQVLADAGLLNIPVSTWPLAWGDIAAALDTRTRDLPPVELAALLRVEQRLQDATVTGFALLEVNASAASEPRRIRSFEDGPREEGEIGVGISWTGDWLAWNLKGAWVADPADGDEARLDGSYLGVALGNWMLSGNLAERWWGPGWQGSLILGSNQRPLPTLSLERNSTVAFESKWLRWIGPWDMAILWSFLETNRELPDARLFGIRFNFRPFRTLEIGLSRTAMWCGRGRDCGSSTFIDLLAGRDNVGDNVSASREPGNQLGGIDVRWSTRVYGQPLALYSQWIGEDETDFYPTQWLGQFGAETWGYIDTYGSYRVYFEWSDTECDFRFYRSVRNDTGPMDRSPGCAYNHPLYRTGYRYKGESIGHPADGDSMVFTLGGVLTDHRDHDWIATVAIGNLNRRISRANHTEATNKTRYRELELVYKSDFTWDERELGDVGVGLGYDSRRDTVTGISNDDVRVFVDWTFVY